MRSLRAMSRVLSSRPLAASKYYNLMLSLRLPTPGFLRVAGPEPEAHLPVGLRGREKQGIVLPYE